MAHPQGPPTISGDDFIWNIEEVNDDFHSYEEEEDDELDEDELQGNQFQVKHQDLVPRNIMLTDADDAQEHDACAVMAKVIDFSCFKEETPGMVWHDNVWFCADAIQKLIRGSGEETGPSTLGNPRKETGSQVHKGIPTNTDPDVLSLVVYPWLGPELRDLIAQCQAVNYLDDLPDFDELLQTAINAVRNKTPDMFPDPTAETDDQVREFVQMHVFETN
ncbi:hypothetical protein F5Y16DRAFT_404976 [Xylariaceae sp. FL0255]|nr:hypothetical protein F5Y16DRAFT_404976 [Xylariaceae sp. FL0255]